MKKNLVTAVVVFVAAAGVVTPYFFGGKTELLFRQQIDRLALNDEQNIRVVNYQRGWFSSTATTEYSSDTQQTIRLHHKITHGPWGALGFAKVVTTPDPQSFDKSLPSPLFTLVTKVSFLRTYYGTLSVPAFDLTWGNHGELHWKGLESSYSLKLGGQQSLDLTAPELLLKGNDINIFLQGIHLTGSGNLPDMRDKKALHHNWANTALLEVKQAQLGMNRNPPITTAIRFQSDIQDEKQTGFMGWRNQLSLTIEAPEFKASGIDQLHLELQLSHIAKTAMLKLQELNDPALPLQDRENTALLVRNEFLQQPPSLQGNAIISGDLGEGRADLNLNLKPAAPGQSPNEDMDSRLDGSLNVTIKESLLDAIVMAITNGDKQLVESFKQNITEQGNFTHEGDSFNTRLTYENGRALINGKPDDSINVFMKLVLFSLMQP